jgi:ATP-binding cassette, subfamily F, member 3
LINVEKITMQFGGFVLLDEISFRVNKKERIGLVGKNGSGKSTIMKIMAQWEEPASGTITRDADVTVGYLPQYMKIVDTSTVFEEAKKAFAPIEKMKASLEKMTIELSSREDYESDDFLQLANKIAYLSDRLSVLDVEKYEGKIEQTLLGLGFKRNDLNRKTSEFSGGWRMRIELAKILLQMPDVLLLDEPTNHLDIESIQWLEYLLASYSGAVVIISHDKAFLDNLTGRTIEISMAKIYDYPYNYSNYLIQRKERREQELAAYQNQQKLIERTEEFIERFRYKATKAVQVQSRVKMLEKLERIQIDEEDKTKINIRFPEAPRAGSIVFEAAELSKSYGDLRVLNNVDLIIERGEKVAFVGKNGEGKTTMAKIIVGKIQDAVGKVSLGHNVEIGYFAQDQDEMLTENKTVLQTLDDIAVGNVRTKLRDILGAFLFSGEDVDKKVKVLSGGERSRLAMAKLLLQPYNLLVLDEPTNHLDMHSKDILKQALKEYNGSLVMISHDREFLDGLVGTIYEFTNHKIKQHDGDIFAFMKKKKLENLTSLNTGISKQNYSGEESKETQKENKQLYAERKKTDKIIRKTTREIEDIEKKIEALEGKQKELETSMNNENPEGEAYHRLFVAYEKNKKEIDACMLRWEESDKEKEIMQTKRDKLL